MSRGGTRRQKASSVVLIGLVATSLSMRVAAPEAAGAAVAGPETHHQWSHVVATGDGDLLALHDGGDLATDGAATYLTGPDLELTGRPGGQASRTVVLAKYDGAGRELWTVSDAFVHVSSVVVRPDHSVCIGGRAPAGARLTRPEGTVVGTLGAELLPLVACFRSDGQRLWSRLGEGGEGEVLDLATDDTGALVLIGRDEQPTAMGDPPDDVGNADAGFEVNYLAALTPTGTARWRWDVPDGVGTRAIAAGGGIAVLGGSLFAPADLDVDTHLDPTDPGDGLVVALDMADGSLRWHRRLTGTTKPAVEAVQVRGVRVDVLGDTHGDVTAEGDPDQEVEDPDGDDGHRDSWLARWSTAGDLRRLRWLDDVQVDAMAPGPGGRTFVAGWYAATAAHHLDAARLPATAGADGIVLELDAGGAVARARVVTGRLGQVVEDVAPSPLGYVTVTGTAGGFVVGEGPDRVRRSYDSVTRLLSRFGPAEVAGRPRPPNAFDLRPAAGRVRVRWEHEAQGNGGAATTGFDVLRDGRVRAHVGPEIRSYVDRAAGGTTHTYAVRSVTRVGPSAPTAARRVRVGRPAPPPRPVVVSVLRHLRGDVAEVEIGPPPPGRPALLEVELTEADGDVNHRRSGNLTIQIEVDGDDTATTFEVRARSAGGWSAPRTGALPTPGTTPDALTPGTAVVVHATSRGGDVVVDEVSSATTAVTSVPFAEDDVATVEHPDGTTEVPLDERGIGLVVRTGSDGRVDWIRTVADGATPNSLVPPIKAVDSTPDGGAIVAGAYSDTAPVQGGPTLTEDGDGLGAFLVRYDQLGGVPWVVEEEDVDFHDIAVLPDGSTLVVGDLGGFETGTVGDGGDAVDLVGLDFLARYDPDGDLDWARAWPHEVRLADLDVDAEGRVAIAGRFHGTVDLDPTDAVRTRSSNGPGDAFVASIDADDGAVVWDQAVGSRLLSLAHDIDHRPDGGVVLVGALSGRVALGGGDVIGGPDREEVFLSSYTADGTRSWSTVVAHGGFYGTRVLVDADGRIVVSGALSFVGISGPRVHGATLHGRNGTAIDVVDPFGSSDHDGALVGYEPDGDLRWAWFTGGLLGSTTGLGAGDPVAALVHGGRGELLGMPGQAFGDLALVRLAE
jgi:hypothetical protein